MTGESVPVEVGEGDQVLGGTVALAGRLVVAATRVGADTQLRTAGRAWSSGRRPTRPACSGSPTGSAACSCRSSSVWPSLTLARLAAGRRVTGAARHQRRAGRADHRLPVRARPGHADRAAGRVRPRRAAGHLHQGPPGAGVRARHRHRRAGQDRHRHHRPDGRRRRPGHRRTPTGPTLLRTAGRGGGRVRARGRRRDRRARPRRTRRPARGRPTSPACAGLGARGVRRRARRCWSGRPGCSPNTVVAFRPSSRTAGADWERRAAPPCWSPSTASWPACSRWPTP